MSIPVLKVREFALSLCLVNQSDHEMGIPTLPYGLTRPVMIKQTVFPKIYEEKIGKRAAKCVFVKMKTIFVGKFSVNFLEALGNFEASQEILGKQFRQNSCKGIFGKFS